MRPDFRRDHDTIDKLHLGQTIRFLYCGAVSNHEELEGVITAFQGDRVVVDLMLHGSKSELSVHAVKIISPGLK